MRTVHIHGFVYTRSKAIEYPRRLREGTDILTFDSEVRAWVLVRVLSKSDTTVLLKGLEGYLVGETWAESYEHLADPDKYRLTGGSPKRRSPLRFR